ncbi:MAG: hypothetical protein KH009_10445, partial [Clostridiales bacterium]|nr:hypothetical protein [Clostridiales bacterium]
YTRDGRLTIYDLKPGTYYIEEVKAPDGYQKAEEPLKIVVEDRDMKVEFTNRPSTPPEQPKPIPDTGRSTLGTEKCRWPALTGPVFQSTPPWGSQGYPRSLWIILTGFSGSAAKTG